MYELIAIEEDEATRFLKLRNLESNVVEECFDDSSLVSEDNFAFMKVGKVYNCKIKLFGRTVSEKTEKSISCKVANNNVIVGNKVMVMVLSQNGNEFYIPKQKVANCEIGNVFEFHNTRKDLIQVENVIHADFF